MPEDAFLTAVQKTTAGTLSLGEVINAAGSLVAAGRTPLAQQLYKIWLNFNREHGQAYVAHFNCAGLHTSAGELAEAEAHLTAALAIDPDFLPAYVNLGGVLERAGALDRAIEQWNAVVNRPLAVTGSVLGYKIAALKQLARVYTEHQKLDSAEAALRQSLDLAPGQREILEQYLALRLGQCKWPVVEPWEGVARRAILRGVHPLSAAAYSDDPMLQLGASGDYVAASVAEPENLGSDRRGVPIDLAGRRLRVGYVSSDLRDHAVGYLMAELFELHDREKVEVFAYYCGRASTEALNGRIQAAVEHWVDIRELSDEAAAARIAADGIDILVDVNGHTRDARIGVFARRPAPIQVNWLGYPGTMASPFHHYIIADDWIIPPEFELYYTERVLRLPCYQPNDRKRVVADERPTRTAAGLPDGAVVFCCFNGAQKITRFTFDRWLEILKRVPDSVLWLLENTEHTARRLCEYAEREGVARSRLVFAPKQPNPQHLARYPLADLFLDTAPYGAHTTASDALWMGVPVLTLSGRSFASRVCGSLVRAAGAPELICGTPEAYVERAVALVGEDRAELDALRARLEAGRDTCELFDMELLTGRLEALYQEMRLDYQRNGAPKPDLTNLDAYLDAGAAHDHEAVEVQALVDYDGLYKAALAHRHRWRPLPADRRLWTAQDIAAVEGEPAPVEGAPPRLRAVAGQ